MSVSGRFIEGEAGPLAVVGWEPAARVRPRFAVLHLPAFAEEMNKSRRMVAMQARAFEGGGGATFVLDPRGTGDSAGEFADATWAGWRADAVRAWSWLRGEVPEGTPCVLWGLRLGALLAIDLVATEAIAPDGLLLWQPVASGRTFVNQFLRVAAARDALGAAQAERESVRARLARGESAEVAGYELAPQLVAEVESVDPAALPVPRCPIVVCEASPSPSPEIAPAVAKLVARWSGETAVDARSVEGPSFWAAQEIETAPRMIDATSGAIDACLQRALATP